MDAELTPTELEARLATFPPPTLVDVRRQPAFEADTKLIPGAIRRPPEALDTWAAPLEPWRPVVVYCVRGHEVSQNAAAALRARGLEAGLLSGGLERWCAEGHPTKPFAAATRCCAAPVASMPFRNTPSVDTRLVLSSFCAVAMSV